MGKNFKTAIKNQINTNVRLEKNYTFRCTVIFVGTQSLQCLVLQRFSCNAVILGNKY